MIIHPFQCECDACKLIDEWQKARKKALQYIYNNDALVREKADELHHSRMLGPPTCLQCIQIAARKRYQELTII